VGVEQALQRGLARVLGHAFGEVRHDDAHAVGVVGFTHLKICGLPAPDLARLFPEDDVHLAREAAHQMLRPLEHEVPPQVRKAD